MTGSFIYDGVRTPFGRFRGALKNVRPDDLAAQVVKALVARFADLDPERIDEAVFGNANGAGEENRNVARMATLLAGLPTSVTGTTVNRLCGSSLDAAAHASRAIEVGDADLMLVGGVESMTRAPWVMLKPERDFPPGDAQLASTSLGWRLVNKAMPAKWTASLGESTEQLREKYDVTRADQDEFSVRSHRLAAQAWDEGFYADQVIQVAGVELDRDESIRPDSTIEKVGALRPSFRPDGTVTAGNASPLSDGAGALFLGSDSAGDLLGAEPLVRIAGRGVHGVEPQFFGIAPVEAANKALARAGIGWADVGLVELNEAFAAQSLACVRQWPIDPEIVNPHGGAIAIGHPLGASGIRLLLTAARSMVQRGIKWGVAGLCIGVGQGQAVVLENTRI